MSVACPALSSRSDAIHDDRSRNITAVVRCELPGQYGRYRPPAGCYDELMASGEGVHRHWRSFVDMLDLLGEDEVRRRWEESQDLIRQNGVTYNVYGDPRGTDRPWQLDPIPLLMSPSEWKVLEEGLIQRATLLDMILVDLYGPQHTAGSGSSTS